MNRTLSRRRGGQKFKKWRQNLWTSIIWKGQKRIIRRRADIIVRLILTNILSDSSKKRKTRLTFNRVTRFGEILPLWQKFTSLRQIFDSFFCGKMLSLLGQICDIIGLILIDTNGQILKNNLTIWSHWLISTRERGRKRPKWTLTAIVDLCKCENVFRALWAERIYFNQKNEKIFRICRKLCCGYFDDRWQRILVTFSALRKQLGNVLPSTMYTTSNCTKQLIWLNFFIGTTPEYFEQLIENIVSHLLENLLKLP